jgi:GT2 family glycosyltransferase
MSPLLIDIIIISNAKNQNLRILTENTIKSLLESESSNKFIFNIIVIESSTSADDYAYPNTKTIKPNEKFGYHKYLNIGAKLGNSPYIGFANNDLIFHPGWLSSILEEMKKDISLESVGTWCPKFHPINNVKKEPIVQPGYTNGIHMTGWFIFMKRSLYNKLEGFDENFIFWYCDDDYRRTLESEGIRHALITSAEITHITSQSISDEDPVTYKKLTQLPHLYYDYKWNHKSYIIYILKKMFLILSLKWNKK